MQFLWFSILYGLSFLTDDKFAFLTMASTLGVVLTCLPYFIIWRFSSDTWQSPRSLLAGVMALLWLVICLYPSNRYLVGLESPLHAFLIWMIVLQYTRVYLQVTQGSVRSSSVLFFAVLLVLNTWTRLDSFGLSASFLALLLFTVAGRLTIAMYAVVAVIIGIGTVVLFAFFELAGGSLLPVSALVKGYGVDRFSLGSFYNWSLVLFPLRIPGANLLNVLGIVAMFGSLGILLRMRTVAHDHHEAALRLIALALSASVIIHSIVTFGMFRYYYFCICRQRSSTGPSCLAILSVDVSPAQGPGVPAVRSGVNPVLFWLGRWWVCFGWLVETPDNLAATRYDVANWMNATPGRRLDRGVFNAGQLGFFSDRPVVNLDGLINDVTYFERVIQDESPGRAAYLYRRCRHRLSRRLPVWPLARRLIERQFTTVHEFPLASGGVVKVMKRSASMM